MPQAATKAIGRASIQPAASVIDRSHLTYMTFGDRSLERELLQLFDRQAGLLIARMSASEPAAVATLAHTLKGSAVSIGAASVARAAETVELACAAGAAECGLAVNLLAVAIDEARATIAELLRAH